MHSKDRRNNWTAHRFAADRTQRNIIQNPSTTIVLHFYISGAEISVTKFAAISFIVIFATRYRVCIDCKMKSRNLILVTAVVHYCMFPANCGLSVRIPAIYYQWSRQFWFLFSEIFGDRKSVESFFWNYTPLSSDKVMLICICLIDGLLPSDCIDFVAVLGFPSINIISHFFRTLSLAQMIISIVFCSIPWSNKDFLTCTSSSISWCPSTIWRSNFHRPFDYNR